MKKIICAIVFTVMVSLPSAAAEKLTLAIMDFEARDVPRSDAVKVSELIRNELINSGSYILIERAQVDKILKEQGFQATGCTDVSCAVQMGKLLSARKILVGSIMKLGDNITITGRIVDVEKGINDFGEKVTVANRNDLIDGVEQFCSKLTERITGKASTKKKETEKKSDGIKYYSYSYGSSYDAVSDPTLWLGVGSLVVGGIICAGNAMNYNFKYMSLKQQLDGSQFMLAGTFGFPDPAMVLYFYSDIQSKKNDIKKLKSERNTVYYVGAGFGGFAAIMFITFIGRYVSNNTASADRGAGSIAIVFPEQYFNVADMISHKRPGFGMGLSMRF
jgi:hypothetical protein